MMEGEEHVFPSLVRRYLATATDGLLVLASLFVVTYALPGDSLSAVRIAIVAGMFFVYEPLCTSRWCTVGQRMLGVRVRTFPEIQRISLARAYLRILMKVFLGALAFLSIGFSKQRRGIHDIAAMSVVVRRG